MLVHDLGQGIAHQTVANKLVAYVLKLVPHQLPASGSCPESSQLILRVSWRCFEAVWVQASSIQI